MVYTVVLLGEFSPFFAVLWIRIGFSAHPDPAFHLNADPDPDPDPGSQTNADQDPDLFQTLKAQKFEFLHETYSVRYLLTVENRSKTYLTKVQKPFLKAGNHVYLIILVNFDTPGQCCGSGMFIPDPYFSHPGSRVKKISGSAFASKNLSILIQKFVYKLSEIWFKIFIPDPDLDFLPIPYPGFRGQKGIGSGSAFFIRVWIPNIAFLFLLD
jgi:hypothetical protein